MKTLKEKIEVMQAALDGKEVEVKHHLSPEWFLTVENTPWNWEKCDYRIKPEPMEFYLDVYQSGFAELSNGKVPKSEACCSGYIKTIKVREVIE